MKKKIVGIVSTVIGIIFTIIMVQALTSISSTSNEYVDQNSNSNSTNYTLTNQTVNSNPVLPNKIKRFVHVEANNEGKIESLYLPVDDFLFNVDYETNDANIIETVTISLKPELTKLYSEIGFFDKPADTVVIYPIFTQAAYGKNGFYDYYNKTCDEKCLTVNIPTQIIPVYQSSARAYLILQLLKYDSVTDVDVYKNPQILDKYKKVIVLHSEYVTQREFDAITNHANVLYLFPNALYAKVKTDYDTNTFTLIRGHGYPDSNITNGFNWEFDNTKFEYDVKCNDWKIYAINNGAMINCYPSFRLYLDEHLLRSIFDLFR